VAARLPFVGGDDGDWGMILNQFLEVAHNADGTLTASAVANALPTTIPATNLGTGTPTNTNYLRGDGTWATPASGGVSTTAANTWSAPQTFNAGDLLDKGEIVFDAKAYGATGNGSTDDTTAIQAALNAAPSGGVVYLPAGTYKISSPLVVPPTITFRGTTRTFWFPSEGGTSDGVLAPTSKIMPSALFSGAAAVRIVDQSTGGYSAGSGNQTLAYLTVDGSNLPGGNTVDGFQTYGSTFGLTMDSCAVTNVGGHGFETAYHVGSGEGYGFLDQVEMRDCIFNAITGDGVHLAGTADSVFIGCHAINCSNAWYVEDVGNSRFLGCRAEWSVTGWNVQWPANTGNIPRQTFVGCSTDNNTGDGFYLTGGQTGGFVLLDGCDFHEDGRGAGTSAAGIHISGAGFPVMITGCGVFIDSTATTGYGPAYGLLVDTSSVLVSVENTYLQGNTSAYHTDGTGTVVIGTNVSVSNGGTPTAPTTPSLLAPTSQNATMVPADEGFLGWAYDTSFSSVASNQPTAGLVSAVRIKVPACTISYIWLGINAPGSGLTSGQNFAGLYSSTGATLLSATADQSAAWESGYLAVKMALTTPQTVPAGWVYVAWFSNGTTIPKFQMSGTANSINANLTNATARFATGGSGATTAMPSLLTLAATANAYWAAVS
jgi:hypothetical protein